MKVLVACEFSGVVRDAFRRKGHEAWSCDLEGVEPKGEWPNYHLYGDALSFLSEGWDLLIAHPPCTYLTVSAEWAYKDGPYHQRLKPETLTGLKRREAREEAVEFFRNLWEVPIPRIAIENPIGCISSRICRPSQIIQPHQFGHDASKATCLWLKGLPPLTPTDRISPRIVNGRPRWSNQTDNGQNRLSPSSDRWSKRSITYPGIAAAMAGQWGTAIPEP